MDFEAEIPVNVLRRVPWDENDNMQNNPRTRITKKYKVFDYIPLTLNHLSDLNQDSWKEGNVVSIFDGRIYFKNCLVYSNVLDKREMASGYSFIVDDGTGTMEIKVHNQRDLNSISKLENEVNEVLEQVDIVKSLRNLLLATRTQLCSTANITAGSRILAIGKPSYFREVVSIDAFKILKNESADRKIEIAFKNELINWYKNNLLHL